MRIGIVGSDNSHAIAYSTIANVEKRVGDHRVTMICGDDPARTQEVAGLGEIPQIVDGPNAMIGNVDAAIVVNRHGDLHAGNAIPLLEAGIPVYVDKPFAVSIDDCDAILAAAERGRTWVTSFSSLRWAAQTDEVDALKAELGEVRAAQFSGPCDFNSEYAGPFFYATHVADIMFRLLGHEFTSVQAQRVGANVAVTVGFASDSVATILYTNDTSYHFTATLFGEQAYAHREILAGQDSYAAALAIFLAAVDSGQPPLDPARLNDPIRFVHAINESLAANGEVIRA